MLARALIVIVASLAPLSCENNPPPRRDACVPDAAPPTHELLYVLNAITIDATDSPTIPHSGFNVDGLFSGPTDPNGCDHQDFLGFDADQNCPQTAADGTCPHAPGCALFESACAGGVDNQLPTLANTLQTVGGQDARTAWSRAIAELNYVLLVRVTGVDDIANDPNVRVSIFRGEPDFTSFCSPDLPLQPTRSFAPIQTMARRRSRTLASFSMRRS